MKYYFTQPQFEKCFNNLIFDKRKEYMMNIINNLPVIYDEVDPNAHMFNDLTAPDGFWGYLEGDEKHISWILLQL